MSRILEVNDPDCLPNYRMVWERLFVETPNASFFQSFDWFEAYWRHYGAAQRLRLLIVESCGKVIGIVPLCVRQEQHRLGPVRVLSYPVDADGYWCAAVGADQTATILLAMQYVRYSKRDWDTIDLRWHGRESCDDGRPARAMRIAGLEPKKQVLTQRTLFECHSAQIWLPRLLKTEIPGNTKIVRHRPGPARDGDGDPRWDLYRCCEEIDRTQNGHSANRNQHVIRNELHEAAARRGMVDLNLLLVDNRPTAYAYNYHQNGIVRTVRKGSVATTMEDLLLVKLIEDSYQRNDFFCDYGPATSEFQKQACSGIETTYQLSHIPLASLRSQAARLSRWVASHWPSRQQISKRSAAL